MTEPKYPHHFRHIGALALNVAHRSALRTIAANLDAVANGNSDAIARIDPARKALGLDWSDLPRDRRAK